MVSGGLLALLLTGACAKPSPNPEPVLLPTVSSTAPVTSIPAVANITVRPAPTTPPPPPTVAETTEPPPPPPVQVPPEPEPRPTTVPTTTPPRFDEVALEGFPCEEQGATAVDPAGRKLVCTPTRRGRLVWGRP